MKLPIRFTGMSQASIRLEDYYEPSFSPVCHAQPDQPGDRKDQRAPGIVRGGLPNRRSILAIRENKVILVKDVKTDTRMEPWREQVLENGFRSLAAVPLTVGEHVMGVLDLYAAQVDFFDTDELSLLEGIGRDISFALEAMGVEEERFLHR